MSKVQTLKNGTRVHIVPLEGTQAASLLVLFRVGSRNEPLKVWGGSHFIEHLMFKGTKKRPETIDISKELDRYGAEYNAYTGKDLTGYWVKIAAEQIPVAVDLLHDMLFNSKFEATEMTREKKVIIEEIKMYEENPIMHLEDMLEEAIFATHTLGRNIAGTPASMTAMKRADVLAYRDAYYVPENMVIALAGNVPKDAMALLEKTFGKVKAKPTVSEVTPFTIEGEWTEPRVRIQEKKLEQIQVSLGFPAFGRDHADTDALRILAGVLGGTMSSRLFIEVREKRGLCYNVRASADFYEDTGLLTVRAGLDASRLSVAMKVIVGELKKIAKNGVTPAELKMAKDNVKGSTTLRLEDSSNLAEYYARQELFHGKVETAEERLSKFSAVKLADVKRVAAEIINFRRLSIAAIGPYKNEADLLKHFPKDMVK
ncbi:MAG: pitrilysin family protein [Patescibacteria group bacterium]